MHGPDERSELIRAVTKRGEAVSVAAARLGVPLSTAHRWIRIATAATTPARAPTFVEVVPERAVRSAIVVRVGVAEIEVRPGFDARLLREVAEALGGGA
jgi:transposase-like protein